MTEIEKDYRELHLDENLAIQTGSSRAIRVARQKTEAKVIQRRPGYDDALVRADQIADDADATSAPSIRCLQTICPHLSCGVDYVVDRGAFSCPCHVSEFDAGGKRLSGPSPRDMDELECRVTPPDEDGRRWVEVRYQEFRCGTPDKRLVT